VRATTYGELKRWLEAERPVGLATIVEGPGIGCQLLVGPDGERRGELGSAELDAWTAGRLQALLAEQGSERVAAERGGEPVDLFLEILAPRPRLIVVGAGHIAIPLVRMAAIAGFRTCVVDPRAAFATAERFPEVDERIVDWPAAALERLKLTEASFVAVLAHDPKIDLPALLTALRSPARYVGLLGSKRTRANRLEALRGEGCSDEEIGRMHAPIGLDIGGRSPEEIAVSILAEIVAVRNGIRAR